MGSRDRKTPTIGRLLAVCLLPGLLFAGGGCSKEGETGKAAVPLTGDPSMEVATVNGKAITLREVNRVIGAWRTGRFSQIDLSVSEAELQAKAIDELINQHLLFAAASGEGKAPTEDELSGMMTQMRGRFPDEQTFQTLLAQQGVTEEELKEGMRMDTAIRRYVQEVIQDTIQVTSGQAQTYFDEHPDEFVRPETVRARHILIRVAPEATDEQAQAARSRIESLETRIRQGADFAALAQENSDDPGSGQRGGDLGFFERGRMVPPFDSAAFALGEGQLSGPIRTQFGYHLIKVEEKRPPGVFSFAEVESLLTRRLFGLRTSDRIEELVEELRKEADIKRKI